MMLSASSAGGGENKPQTDIRRLRVQTLSFTSHSKDQRPVGAVQLVGKDEAQRNDGAQEARVPFFYSPEQKRRK